MEFDKWYQPGGGVSLSRPRATDGLLEVRGQAPKRLCKGMGTVGGQLSRGFGGKKLRKAKQIVQES